MITKTQIEYAYNIGVISLIDSIDCEGVECAFGAMKFAIGGHEGEKMTAKEYMEAIPAEDIVEEIFNMVESFRNSGTEESIFTYFFLERYMEDNCFKRNPHQIYIPLGYSRVSVYNRPEGFICNIAQSDQKVDSKYWGKSHRRSPNEHTLDRLKIKFDSSEHARVWANILIAIADKIEYYELLKEEGE